MGKYSRIYNILWTFYKDILYITGYGSTNRLTS